MTQHAASSPFVSALKFIGKAVPVAAFTLSGLACGAIDDGPPVDPDDEEVPIEIDFGGEPDSDPDAVPAPAPGPVPNPGQTEECLTLDGSQVLRISLDNGGTESVVTLRQGGQSFNPTDVTSLARIDDELYFCDIDRQLQKASLTTGEVMTLPVPCEAAAAWGEGLVLLPDLSAGIFDAGLSYYSAEAIADGFEDRPEELGIDPFASRLTVVGDVAFFAWHSTDTISRFDLNTREELPSITMENYDTWVQGMAGRANGELAVNASWPEERIAILDGEDGSAIRDLGLSRGMLSGLNCTQLGD